MPTSYVKTSLFRFLQYIVSFVTDMNCFCFVFQQEMIQVTRDITKIVDKKSEDSSGLVTSSVITR